MAIQIAAQAPSSRQPVRSRLRSRLARSVSLPQAQSLPAASLRPVLRQLARLPRRFKEFRLLRRYRKSHGLTLDGVQVTAHRPVSQKEKRQLVVRALEAYEHAKKSQLADRNFSGRHFATHLKASNGRWSLGTNMELSREQTFCGERSAIVIGWNRAFESLRLPGLLKGAKPPEGLNVDQLVLMNDQAMDTDYGGPPCADCQSWMATAKYFPDDLELVNLTRKANDDGYTLQLQTLGQLLPRRQARPSLSQRTIGPDFPVRLSPGALKAQVDKQTLRQMMRAAQDEYRHDDTDSFSGAEVAATALVETDTQTAMETAPAFEWTRRWREAADLSAITRAFERLDNPAGGRVRAVAYYGDDPARTPPVASLGRMSQERGGPDVLIATVDDSAIKVRTLREYMPSIYDSSKK